MSYDDCNDRAAHWTPSVDPAQQERDRELDDRCLAAEIAVEPDFIVSDDPPPPLSERQIMRLASLTPGEWAHIKGKKRFRDRYAFSRCDLWAFWTAAVIVHARSFLLRDFRTARELQAERLDRARLKAAKRQAAETNRDGTPFKRSPEERAKTAEGMRRYWATKKAKS